mgnify:CR=1 FL=1
MKNLIIISLIALTLGLSSCAFLDAQKANWVACQADADCLNAAKGYKDKTELLATVAASAVPIPGAAAAPKLLGWIGYGLAMLFGGAAVLRKKNVS